MNCSDCGAVNPPDARFCGDCGHRFKGAKKPARQEEAKQGAPWDSVFKWIGVLVVIGFVLGSLGF